jgi:thioredoxin-dependent peroxiredoxin
MKSENRLSLFGRKSELSPGDPAPDFELAGSDGRTYHLQDYVGVRPVVLAWFPKAFTGG